MQLPYSKKIEILQGDVRTPLKQSHRQKFGDVKWMSLAEDRKTNSTETNDSAIKPPHPGISFSCLVGSL